MDNIECGGYTFCSNFDSGNLAKVQLVRCMDILASDKIASIEINAWTKPDCAGTEYENPNRSWFFFSIQGGKPNRICKLNVMNLNKQVKLFSQGMHPVMRVGAFGKWERMKESPTFTVSETDFELSLMHAPGENVNTKFYYAFTFPFTYTEGQNLLDKFDRLLLKTPEEMIENIAAVESSSFVQPEATTSTGAAAATPAIDCDKANDIYYHRELLTQSVEMRRVDLLTISSFHGIQQERERRLTNLFNEVTQRSHTFKDKKIIFISSRVHPGETPASFVLNGFLKMILDRKNRYAIVLRRLFVFKIVPFLNPDGVFNGSYRTDSLGQNLNRVYLAPTQERQPTIFAVRKLLRYYHDGQDIEDVPGTIDATMDREGSNENDISEISCDAEPSTSQSDATDENTENIMQKPRPPKIALKLVNKNQQKLAASYGHNACCSGNRATLSLGEHSVARSRIVRKPLRKDVKFAKHNSVALAEKVPKVSRMPKFTAFRARSNALPLRTNINISSDFLPKCTMSSDCNAEGEQSNLFLYIDLHGHASKKGIFMYGNHLPNLSEAVECMLLPRLMSINSQHFHYDACVFSERNMYHRGKRDGLSKEGSGRVAIYKMTGLIKSYTLEGNYNTGNYVNMLPPRGKELNMRKALLSAPKYTPLVFEDVGRAIGPSILDLINANPASRLPNSEFHSLQGLRNALRTEIDKRGLQNLVPNKLTSRSKFRPSSSTSTTPCYYLVKSDALKENKSKASTSATSMASTSKSAPSYRRIDRHRLIRSKLESQQVPPKRSKVLASAKSVKSDESTKSTSLVEILIADTAIDLSPLDKSAKSHLKVPLVMQRRNSFNGITRKDLLAQPSTSTAAISLDAQSSVAHCSNASPFTIANPIKTKSNLSSFRRRKSKRLTETRPSNVTKVLAIKAKTATLQKKRSV